MKENKEMGKEDDEERDRVRRAVEAGDWAALLNYGVRQDAKEREAKKKAKQGLPPPRP